MLAQPDFEHAVLHRSVIDRFRAAVFFKDLRGNFAVFARLPPHAVDDVRLQQHIVAHEPRQREGALLFRHRSHGKTLRYDFLRRIIVLERNGHDFVLFIDFTVVPAAARKGNRNRQRGAHKPS